jgi:hypothetical protein
MSNKILRIGPGIAITIAVFLAAIAMAPSAHAANGNYTLGATPLNLCVNPGVNGVSAISITGDNNFRGTVKLAYSVDYVVPNSPTLSGNPSSVFVKNGQTVTFNLTMTTNANTPTRLYYITVSDTLVTHQVTVQLNVNHNCSVGGTIVPVDRLSLLSPFANIALSTIAIAGVATASVVYIGRRRRLTK